MKYLYGVFCMFIVPALVFGGVTYILGESFISRLLGFAAAMFVLKLGIDHLNNKFPNG